MRPSATVMVLSQIPHAGLHVMEHSLSTTVMTLGRVLERRMFDSHWSAGFCACSGAITTCSYSQSPVRAITTMLTIVAMVMMMLWRGVSRRCSAAAW